MYSMHASGRWSRADVAQEQGGRHLQLAIDDALLSDSPFHPWGFAFVVPLGFPELAARIQGRWCISLRLGADLPSSHAMSNYVAGIFVGRTHRGNAWPM